MFRSAASRFSSIVRASVARPSAVGATRTMCHGPVETDEQFDKRYENYFNRCEIDAWEIRKGMNDLLGMDLVPDPKVIIAALKACRRLNDFALAVRWLEGCKEKCGDERAKIYPYILNEIRPTLTELGIPTVEEIGYDVPELALQSVYDK